MAEELEDGHRESTRSGDTLLNDFVRGEARSYNTLGAARGDDLHHDAAHGIALSDSRSPSIFGNHAVLLRPLQTETVEAVVDALREFFGARPGGPYAVWSAWPTPDLTEFGFELAGHPPLMVRPAGAPLAGAPGELVVREAVDASGARDFERALIDGYPIDELRNEPPGTMLPARVLGAEGWHHYVGYANGRPVATASAYVDEQHVRIDLVSTLAECRGRGYGAVVTGAATATATDRPATLVSSDLGRKIYEGLGYSAVLRTTLWIGPRVSTR